MCQFRFSLSLSLSLSVSISVSRDLFVFVLFCRAVFHSNIGLIFFFLFFSSLFITLRVPFTSERICGGCSRPFSTCSSLMSFSPFSCFLWLLPLLVASFFCSFLSKAPYGSFLSSVCDFFVFCCCCWAVFHPALSLLVLFSPICWASELTV